jgi:multiple sugar transport system substrate-binding protein
MADCNGDIAAELKVTNEKVNAELAKQQVLAK